MKFKSLVFLLVFSTILFLLKSSYAASVISVAGSSNLDFGVIIVGDSGGSVTSSGNSSGGAKSIGGASSGYFTVIADRSKGKDGKTIKVFLNNLPKRLRDSRGGVDTGDLSLSLSPTSKKLSLELEISGSGSSATSINVPVYGTINFFGRQSPGIYSASYDFVACSCDKRGCPDSVADSLCY